MLPRNNRLLKYHGVFLIVLGLMMTVQTVLGYYKGIGVLAFIHDNPLKSVGLFEAYLLAGFTGVVLIVLSGSHYVKKWHLLGATVHVLLFVTNVLFWKAYSMADIVTIGYVSTGAHLLFILLEGGSYLVLTIKHNNHENFNQ